MGNRKFRLSTKKNYERKKYQKRQISSGTCNSQQPSEVILSCSQDTSAELIVRISRNIFVNAALSSSYTLYTRLTKLWNVSGDWSLSWFLSNVVLTKSFSYGNLVVTIFPDFSSSIKINEYLLQLSNSGLFGERIDSVSYVWKLLSNIDKSQLCIGSPDEKFYQIKERRNGKFFDQSGKNVVAFYDDRLLPLPTIRHSSCFLFVDKDSQRCKPCDEYRSTLHSLATRERNRSDVTLSSSHSNYKFLTSEEKTARLRNIRKTKQALQSKIRKIQNKLATIIETTGVVLDNTTSSDLQSIMEEEESQICKTYTEDSFQSIFWNHQKDAITREKNGIRWHPLMIKWCLYLRHQSGKAYETLRQSGCISLPSQRTLRDYSNAVKASTGFSLEVDNQLMEAANLRSSPDFHRLVNILIDEIHIKEDLVYNKHDGRLTGFVDLGDLNNHLTRFEESLSNDSSSPVLAKSMLVFMVRGLFTKLQFAYAQFPCSSLVGEQLFTLFWKTVFHLERLGFKVLATTFDGASVNRRLVALHDTSDKLVYKLKNIYADEERYIYCFSDPPHLLKTTRNCWNSRNLWNNGKYISWKHLLELYERDRGKGSGLSMVPKLKYEHLHLTTFSKMRVDLAVQVLSESVGKAIPLVVGQEAEETSKFILLFDKFFDIFNVSNFTNFARYRKPFQYPYRNKEDHRLKWLEEEFLPYLDAWEESVQLRTGFNASQKKRMLLSNETLLGIRRTVKSFIELINYMFSLPEVQEHKLAFLSNHLCQDPLECFFGCQRQRGGTNDNPTVQNFFANTQALRVVNSFCRGPVKGNCRGSTSSNETSHSSDLAPLPKRKRN